MIATLQSQCFSLSRSGMGCVLWFSSEKEPGGPIEQDEVEGTSSPSYGGWQVQNLQSQSPSSEAVGWCQAGEFYSEKGQLFGPFRSSTDWMRPTHIREGSMLYSVYIYEC